MPSASYKKLRRLAPRAERVLARRAEAIPALAPFKKTLGPKAAAYRAKYDQAAKTETSWRKEMREGKGAIATLVVAVRAWAQNFLRDVPGFDAMTIGDRPDVPDDVLSDAEQLNALLQPSDGTPPLPVEWRDAAIADLGGKYQSAAKEWQEAEAADSAYQKLLGEVRETGALFDSELQLFRRAFGAVAGTNDKDFQKLRSEKASVKDEDDDADAPPVGKPLEPAPPGAKPPTG